MWKFRKKTSSPIEVASKTIITSQASEEVQNRYNQLDDAGVGELFIKFLKEGGVNMPEEVKYEIVSDVDNKIEYNEIYAGEVDRVEIANYRARVEALKEQKANIEAEIAELEKLLEKGEHIIKLADEKRAEEEAKNNEENAVVEGE